MIANAAMHHGCELAAKIPTRSPGASPLAVNWAATLEVQSWSSSNVAASSGKRIAWPSRAVCDHYSKTWPIVPVTWLFRSCSWRELQLRALVKIAELTSGAPGPPVSRQLTAPGTGLAEVPRNCPIASMATPIPWKEPCARLPPEVLIGNRPRRSDEIFEAHELGNVFVGAEAVVDQRGDPLSAEIFVDLGHLDMVWSQAGLRHNRSAMSPNPAEA